MMIPWVIMFLTAPIILDNGDLRLEADPELFAVRFLGTAQDRNFVDSVIHPAAQNDTQNGLTPSGLVTYILAKDTPAPMLAQGPSDPVFQDKHRVILLGPEVPGLPIRLQKEIALEEKGLQAKYTVTILSASNKAIRLTVRNTARIPEGYSVRLKTGESAFQNRGGGVALDAITTTSKEATLLPIPPLKRTTQTTLSAFAPEIALQTPSEIWTRSAAVFNLPPTRYPDDSSIVCYLDDEKRVYTLAIQYPFTEVDAGAPVSFQENWSFDAVKKEQASSYGQSSEKH